MILEIYMLYGKSYKSKVTEYCCIFSPLYLQSWCTCLTTKYKYSFSAILYWSVIFLVPALTPCCLTLYLHGYAIDLWPNLQEIIAVIFLFIQYNTIQYHFILLSCYLPSLAKLRHFHATDFSIQTRFPHVSQNTLWAGPL